MITTQDTAEGGSGAYLAVVRRRLAVILVPVVIGGLLGAAFASASPGRYEATVDVLVRAGATNPIGPAPTGRTGEVNTATEVQVAASGSVAEVVADRLDGEVGSTELQENVTVLARDDSQVLTFRYTASSRPVARRVAVAFAEGYLEYRSNRIRDDQAVSRQSLETRAEQIRGQLAEANAALQRAPNGSADAAAAQAQQTALASQLAQNGLQLAEIDGLVVNPGSIITSTEPPVATAGLNLPLLVTSGAALGLLLGLLLALAREKTDDRVRLGTAGSTGLPQHVLGVVRHAETRKVAEGLPHLVADDYLALAAKLTAMGARDQVRVLLVTSATLAEHTTAVTARLASALALDGTRVAIVSLRDTGPEVATILGLNHTVPAAEMTAAEGLPSEGLPSEALPREALPSEALPSEAPPAPAPTLLPAQAVEVTAQTTTAVPAQTATDASGELLGQAAAGASRDGHEHLPPATSVVSADSPDAPVFADAPMTAPVQVSVRVTSTPAGPGLISAITADPVRSGAEAALGHPGPQGPQESNGSVSHGHQTAPVELPLVPASDAPPGDGSGTHSATPQATVAPNDGPPVFRVETVPFIKSLGAVTELRRPPTVELLGGIVEELRRSRDWVLIDALPVLQGGGALRAAPVADAVVLVADHKQLRRRDVEAMQESLHWSAVPILGLVLTTTRGRRRGRRP
jgi:capsular polysaccharide biosynthesis protein